MLLLLFGWIVYYVIHSDLATTQVKEAVAARWSAAPRYYRLAYNQISVWLFLLLLRYQFSLPAQPLLPRIPALAIGGYALLALGVVIAVLAMRGYSLSEFAGWAYVRQGAAAANTDLNTGGLNGIVRHPFHAGIIIALGGFFLTKPTLPWLIFVGCAIAYILVGSRLEERKLLQRFGAMYAHYQQRVPMLLPRFGGQSNAN
ncbi:methyltransferase family protein [Hymenobacter sp. HD11105]